MILLSHSSVNCIHRFFSSTLTTSCIKRTIDNCAGHGFDINGDEIHFARATSVGIITVNVIDKNKSHVIVFSQQVVYKFRVSHVINQIVPYAEWFIGITPDLDIITGDLPDGKSLEIYKSQPLLPYTKNSKTLMSHFQPKEFNRYVYLSNDPMHIGIWDYTATIGGLNFYDVIILEPIPTSRKNPMQTIIRRFMLDIGCDFFVRILAVTDIVMILSRSSSSSSSSSSSNPTEHQYQIHGFYLVANKVLKVFQQPVGSEVVFAQISGGIIRVFTTSHVMVYTIGW